MARHSDKDNSVRVEVDAEGEVLESDALPTENDSANEVDQLRSELEAEREKVKEEHDRYLRAIADFSNYRKRHQDERKQIRELAGQEIITKILPIIDNFERALEAAEQSHSFDGLVEGVQLTVRQIGEVLESEGVARIESLGEEFDPMLHEAIQRVETSDHCENTIVEEFQSGYRLGDKLIRPAKVAVACLPKG